MNFLSELSNVILSQHSDLSIFNLTENKINHIRYFFKNNFIDNLDDEDVWQCFKVYENLKALYGVNS